MSDPLDFLDKSVDTPVQPVAPATTQPVEPVVQPTQEVAKGATPEAPVTPAAAQAEGDPKHVPLATFLDMRDKLKDTEKQLNALKTREPVAEIEVPDPSSDPSGYLAFREGQIQLNIINERMNFSERFAVKEHGKESVEKARDWALERFAQDPDYERRIMSEADPYETIIRDYGNQQILTELSDEQELKAFREWQTSRKQAGANGAAQPSSQPVSAAGQPATPQPAAKASVPPPRSIAGAPSSGGGTHAEAQGPGQAFDSLFSGR